MQEVRPLGHDNDIKPLLSHCHHSTPLANSIPPKYLRAPKKCQIWGLSIKPLLSHSTTGEFNFKNDQNGFAQMCRMNPWSQGLFAGGVTQLIGDAAELVASFEDQSFDRILHDPPTFALAGDLYSTEFYTNLARILTPQVRALLSSSSNK